MAGAGAEVILDTISIYGPCTRVVCTGLYTLELGELGLGPALMLVLTYHVGELQSVSSQVQDQNFVVIYSLLINGV